MVVVVVVVVVRRRTRRTRRRRRRRSITTREGAESGVLPMEHSPPNRLGGGDGCICRVNREIGPRGAPRRAGKRPRKDR